MFEKDLKFAYLLDFYQDVLDEHIKIVMKQYYDDDLSLAEIASGVGISRQGVRHLIKKGEEQLEFFESKLGLANYNEKLDLAKEKLECLIKETEDCENLSIEDVRSSLLEIRDLMQNKNS